MRSSGETTDTGLTGTRHLIRLILRRDRIRLPIWILGLTTVIWFSASAVQSVYNTPAKIAAYGATVANSAVGKLFAGIPYDVDTIGGITAYEVTATAGIGAAMMVTFLVVRHTRGEEEAYTAELLRSTVLGRHAAIVATLTVAAGASLVLGALDALALAATGLPWTDTAAHGLALAGVGLSFTAVAVAAAQVTASARGALGLSIAAVLGLFVLRGWGAAVDNWLVWTAPFGWQEGVRPFGETRWWLLAPFVVFTAVMLALASWLAANRDFGAGLLPPRAGRPRATGTLMHPVGLALRQQRGQLLGWAGGVVVLGATFGAFATEVIELVEANPEIGEVLGGADDVVRGYFAYMINFMAVVITGYAISSALRLRHEESAGHAEITLATGISRTRWALSWLCATVIGTLTVLLLMGLSSGAVDVLVTGEPDLFWPLVWASLATAPAVLVLVGVTVLLHGVAPRMVLLAWAPFAFALVYTYLGALLDFPDWAAALSPFWHLPQLPVEDFDATPGLVLLLVTGLAVALGIWGLRRRDLGTG